MRFTLKSLPPSTLCMVICLSGHALLASHAIAQTRPDGARVNLNPQEPARRAITNFSPALRCMDDKLFQLGVRDVTLMMEEMRDATQKVPISARDMMTSAIADMTRRSRALQLSVFGSDQQNLAALLQQMQKQSAFQVLPRFALRGGVSQLDDGVERKAGSVGVTLGSFFGVRSGGDTKLSVLGFDAALVDTERMTLVPGAASKNQAIITSRDTGTGDGEARITNPAFSVSFSFATGRAEGPSQAARNMVELALVELTGKLLRIPYWQCLGVPDTDAEVQREMEDWFLSMEGEELRAHLQERLRERRYYNGPTDGSESAEFTEALARYRKALNLPADAPIDLDFFRKFVTVTTPRGPLTVRRAAAAGEPAARPASAAAVAATAPTGGASAAAATEGTATPAVQIKLARAADPRSPFGLSVESSQAGYLYCYAQDPGTQKIVRIFPNRFVGDPRVSASAPIRIPGKGRFVLKGSARYACLHAPREVYGDLPPPLRWGDFEEVRLTSFEEIRDHFRDASGLPVALEVMGPTSRAP